MYVGIQRARRQFAQPLLEGSVRLGLVEDFNLTVLPDMLGRLLREHTRFELSVETGLSPDLVRRLDANAYDLILATRHKGSTRGEFLCDQQLVWCGSPEALHPNDKAVPLVLYPAPSVSREIILRTLRENGRKWSVRFESMSIVGVRAALLARMGVTALGIGMMPPDIFPLPTSALPPLPAAEYVLETNPTSKDPVVTAFASILRGAAPLIIERLAHEQAGSI